MTTCRFDDCCDTRWKRDLCKLHYGREYHAGRLTPITALDRFKAFLDVGDCWEWTGSKTSDGYGRFRAGRLHLAHRWIWEHLIGPIPPGHEVDHRCKNRACVNPLHLEAVTPLVNWQRSAAPTVRNAARTHCQRGHEFATENTRRMPDGGRACKTCPREVRAARKKESV